MNSLIGLMSEQFRLQRDEYLRILNEMNQAKAEMAKAEERLKLMHRLLELDGKTVELPPEIGQQGAVKKDRKAA